MGLNIKPAMARLEEAATKASRTLSRIQSQGITIEGEANLKDIGIDIPGLNEEAKFQFKLHIKIGE